MMDNGLLKEFSFNPEKGGLFYQDVRYLLIRPETLAVFQKATEKELGERASEILYESGAQGGTLSAKRYRELFNLSDKESVGFMIRMGARIGWGRFELERFDTSPKNLVVNVYHSPFAEAYGPSSSPVCHFIRGVLSGIASVVFGQAVKSTESACLARGDSCCRFELKMGGG